jgi:hypothetical protein
VNISMRNHANAAAGMANGRGANDCKFAATPLHPIDAVMHTARILWPVKTSVNLSIKSGASERACAYWLARKHDMTSEALAALLRSEEGLNFLEAIMGNARPLWWKAFKRRLRRAKLRSDIQELQRELELEDAADTK